MNEGNDVTKSLHINQLVMTTSSVMHLVSRRVLNWLGLETQDQVSKGKTTTETLIINTETKTKMVLFWDEISVSDSHPCYHNHKNNTTPFSKFKFTNQIKQRLRGRHKPTCCTSEKSTDRCTGMTGAGKYCNVPYLITLRKSDPGSISETGLTSKFNHL